MNRLIAGAGGPLGRELVRQSLERGDTVTALVLNRRELQGMEHERLRIREADVTRPDSLKDLCAGQQQVLSCIGITRIKGRLTHETVDYQGNLNLLHEAHRQGVQRFGFISPAGTTEGKDEVPLLAAKHRFEEALRADGTPCTLFRSGGFFNDLAEMKKLAAKGPLYVIGEGRSVSTPIHVADLAGLMLKAMDGPPNEIVSLGGPEDLSWREICERCFEAVGRPVRIHRIPVWLCRVTLTMLRPFSYRYYAMGALLLYMSTHDARTPNRGSRRLRDYLTTLPPS